MKRIIIGLLILMCVGIAVASEYPNGDPKWRDYEIVIGYLDQFLPTTDPTANRAILIPKNYYGSGFDVRSYTGIALDSECSSGSFVAKASFWTEYDYPKGGSYLLEETTFPSNNSAIPIPPRADIVKFSIDTFSDNFSTVNVTGSIRIGCNVGSTLNTVAIPARTATLLKLDDHASFVITKGTVDVWLGAGTDVSVNVGKILDSTYPSHTVDGSYSLYGYSVTATTVDVAEDY